MDGYKYDASGVVCSAKLPDSISQLRTVCFLEMHVL